MAAESELSRLRHAMVVDSEGERTGKVSEIFLNDRTQKVSFVSVALGFFRTKEVYVPFSILDLDGDEVRLRIPRSVLQAAPRANGVGYLTQQQEEDLRNFFSLALDGELTADSD